MTLGRLVGIALLSVVDALVPATLAGLAALTLWPRHLLDGSLLWIAAGTAAVAFVGTLLASAVASATGHGPFAATTATKRMMRLF